MLLLAYGIVRLEHGFAGWQVTVAALAAGLLLAGAFVAVERRAATPLVRLGILSKAPLVRADLGALLFVGSFFGFQFMATLYLQELRGWSSLQTALALLVMGVDAVLAPTLTPRLVARFGNARVILGGFVLAVVSYALFLPVGPDWSYAAMFPTLFLTGLAFALAYGPLTISRHGRDRGGGAGARERTAHHGHPVRLGGRHRGGDRGVRAHAAAVSAASGRRSSSRWPWWRSAP